MTAGTIVLAALILAAAIILAAELVRTALVPIGRAFTRVAGALETSNTLTSTHNDATRAVWDRNQTNNEELRAKLARDVERAAAELAAPPAPAEVQTGPGPVEFLAERRARRDDDQGPTA